MTPVHEPLKGISSSWSFFCQTKKAVMTGIAKPYPYSSVLIHAATIHCKPSKKMKPSNAATIMNPNHNHRGSFHTVSLATCINITSFETGGVGSPEGGVPYAAIFTSKR